MFRKIRICVALLLVLGICTGTALAELIAYWPFDEGQGTDVSDVTGNGNDGTFNGAVEWVLGHKGTAVRLDTAGERIVITALDPTAANNAMTLAAWINWEGQGHSITHQGIFGKRRGWDPRTNVKWFWEAQPDGDLVFRNADAGVGYNSLILAPYVNQWIHVAVTWDNGDIVQYVNAEEVLTGNLTFNDTADATVMSIGCVDSQNNETFVGSIDEARIYDTALDVAGIQKAMTGDTTSATIVSPGNESTDVRRDIILRWSPGEFARTHDVYFGTVFADVNDASRTNPLNVLVSQGQDANTYDPAGLLELDQTYYWRIDEVNAPPDYTIFKGKVWSFTTEPFVYAVENVTATASSSELAQGPENTVNGSGLDDSGLLHDKGAENNMWSSSIAGPQPTWIEFQFDKVYKLHEMWVWNYNSSLEAVLGFGFKDVTIEYSTNGTDYMTLGTTHEFARAPGVSDYAHNTIIDMGGVAAKYIRLTANSNWGGILPQYGLSEVRFFYIPVYAREPDPESGARDVPIGTIDNPVGVTLGFRAGREAAKHDVYFSSDWQAVIDGTAPVTTVTEASHGPLALDLGQSYYWRVDEVNEAETPTTWQGPVWNFTTQEYFVVDDFESYNDLDTSDPNSNRVYLTWIDGWDVPTNGSQAGYTEPPFCEQTIVHGGKQSMPLFYDNSDTARYSEATMTLSAPQDWTIRGAEALSLWFRGNPAGFVEEPPGTYTMTAAGVDIWGTADEFRYAWKQLSGDGEIAATVESVLWVPGSNDWSKAGVMIRETLDAGSKNAFIAITSGAGDGATFQWRNSTGGSSSSSRTLVGISPPAAIRLVRQGNTFTGYVFLDGQWQQEGQSATVPMVNPVYIGLALTSHSSGVTTEAVFSNVTTTGAVTGAFTPQAIGVDMPANTADPMYVAVASGGGTPAVVRHDDPGATQTGDWTEWSIDLKQFSDAGVNLTNVDSISLGVGDKSNPQPGGAGLVYVDDIRLYPHREPPEEISLEAEAADSITEPMKVYDDPGASGGQYIGTDDGIGDENSNPPADGIATYSFTVKGGIYKILLRVIITGGSNSFWVRVPGATNYDPGTDPANPGWIRFNDIEDGDTWHWDEVHSNDHNNEVVLITLPPGPHTLEIVRREDGALLDAILITNAVD